MKPQSMAGAASAGNGILQLADRAPAPQTQGLSAYGATLLQLQGATVQLAGLQIGPFTLDVQAGQRVAILGPSGAGKSTLLRLMSGERPPQVGAVQLAGRSLAAWPQHRLALHRAVLPQSHAVAFGLRVDLVASLGRIAREPDPAQAAIVAAALEAACAAHLAGRRFDTLSGGEQARVQMARVLAQAWDTRDGLLLVDEPLAALDPGLQLELMDVLQAFASERGHALVAVLHDLNQALAGFDRLWLLAQGRLAAEVRADPSALPALEVLFGISLRCVEERGGRVAVLARRRATTLTDVDTGADGGAARSAASDARAP